jgi:hypothetical protein
MLVRHPQNPLEEKYTTSNILTLISEKKCIDLLLRSDSVNSDRFWATARYTLRLQIHNNATVGLQQ